MHLELPTNQRIEIYLMDSTGDILSKWSANHTNTKKPVTILFSDIRGFTTMTEKTDAAKLVAQLNEYFAEMVNVIQEKNSGTLQKFIGDAIMAAWGDTHSEGLETDAQRPMSPYAASKAAADSLAYSYWTTHHLPVVITRCGNNYGPYQYPEKQLPLFILNALENRPLPIYGTGSNIRDWIHVFDHAEAIMTLLHADGEAVYGEVFNIGASEERTILQNAHAVLELLEKPQSLIRFVGDRQGHVFRHAVDASKLKRVCNWRPTISFLDGIRQTVAWYQENTEWIVDVNARNNVFLEHALHLAEEHEGDHVESDSSLVESL